MTYLSMVASIGSSERFMDWRELWPSLSMMPTTAHERFIYEIDVVIIYIRFFWLSPAPVPLYLLLVALNLYRIVIPKLRRDFGASIVRRLPLCISMSEDEVLKRSLACTWTDNFPPQNPLYKDRFTELVWMSPNLYSTENQLKILRQTECIVPLVHFLFWFPPLRIHLWQSHLKINYL